jgi:membrane-associated protease RseP (regulator of RpoE activity)
VGIDVAGRAIWSRVIGYTTYGIGWLPTGAYTKLAGFDQGPERMIAERWEYFGRPLLVRLSILAAGTTANVLAVLLIMHCAAPTLLLSLTLLINTGLAVRNLLPFGATDGARILWEFSDAWLLRRTERRVLTVLWLIGVCYGLFLMRDVLFHAAHTIV